MKTQTKENKEFTKRTNKALKRIEQEKGFKTSFNNFIKEMKTW